MNKVKYAAVAAISLAASAALGLTPIAAHLPGMI